MNKLLVGIGAIFCTTSVLAADISQTASNTVDSFEKLFGVTEGKRRNHTKGFCFEGTLMPIDKTIQQYTNSPLFTTESRVIGRLSHKGGNNAAPDSQPAEYGMGLSISSALGQHNMSMNTLDFFPVATPEAFAELMRAKTRGSDAVKAFKKKNTDLQRFKAHMSTKTKTLRPYEGSTFNSINSFYLIDKAGKKTAVRWSFVPAKQQAIVLEPQQDFFYENMQHNLLSQGIVWDMVFTLANTDDVVDNASVQWVGKHTRITAAQLKVLAISSEENGECDNINYDPLVLSRGFEATADPLLQARRSSYAISFGKRVSEKQKQNK